MITKIKIILSTSKKKELFMHSILQRMISFFVSYNTNILKLYLKEILFYQHLKICSCIQFYNECIVFFFVCEL